jgi:hypothetical protein
VGKVSILRCPVSGKGRSKFLAKESRVLYGLIIFEDLIWLCQFIFSIFVLLGSWKRAQYLSKWRDSRKQ